jgi:hypothetical protein
LGSARLDNDGTAGQDVLEFSDCIFTDASAAVAGVAGDHLVAQRKAVEGHDERDAYLLEPLLIDATGFPVELNEAGGNPFAVPPVPQVSKQPMKTGGDRSEVKAFSANILRPRLTFSRTAGLLDGDGRNVAAQLRLTENDSEPPLSIQRLKRIAREGLAALRGRFRRVG